jgi:hypothetical protein
LTEIPSDFTGTVQETLATTSTKRDDSIERAGSSMLSLQVILAVRLEGAAVDTWATR